MGQLREKTRGSGQRMVFAGRPMGASGGLLCKLVVWVATGGQALQGQPQQPLHLWLSPTLQLDTAKMTTHCCSCVEH